MKVFVPRYSKQDTLLLNKIISEKLDYCIKSVSRCNLVILSSIVCLTLAFLKAQWYVYKRLEVFTLGTVIVGVILFIILSSPIFAICYIAYKKAALNKKCCETLNKDLVIVRKYNTLLLSIDMLRRGCKYRKAENNLVIEDATTREICVIPDAIKFMNDSGDFDSGKLYDCDMYSLMQKYIKKDERVKTP